ncbi:MAG: hypothetical protein ACXAC7_13925 [Candidatus Hodarchaeales archaeon]|jgi:uncharacterized protein YoxC
MSDSNQIKIIAQILKELMKKLDTKFETIKNLDTKFSVIIEVQKYLEELNIKVEDLNMKVEGLQTQVDNFRAFTERSNYQMNEELVKLQNMTTPSYGSTERAVPLQPERPTSQVSSKKFDKTLSSDKEPLIREPRPTAPVPVGSSFSPFPNLKSPPSATPHSSSKLSTKYAGLKETPIVTASKADSGGLRELSDDYYKVHRKRKRNRKKALTAYMEKLDKVILTTWPIVDEAWMDKQLEMFVDKGLTVLHGIIEFLYVGFRQEFPDQTLDYYSKAKNISGLGLFKDVSLLDKMEKVYSELERGEKPVLAVPLVRGWHSRLESIFDGFQTRSQEAYNRIRK